LRDEVARGGTSSHAIARRRRSTLSTRACPSVVGSGVSSSRADRIASNCEVGTEMSFRWGDSDVWNRGTVRAPGGQQGSRARSSRTHLRHDKRGGGVAVRHCCADETEFFPPRLQVFSERPETLAPQQRAGTDLLQRARANCEGQARRHTNHRLEIRQRCPSGVERHAVRAKGWCC